MFLHPFQKNLIRVVCDKYNIHTCILFGSFAKGTANYDSDIDLIVSEITEDKINSLQMDLMLALSKSVDIIGVPPHNIVKGLGVYEYL